jgi:hypothetical protein
MKIITRTTVMKLSVEIAMIMIATIGIKLMHRLSPRMPLLGLLVTIMSHYLCMHTVRKNYAD